MSTTAKIQLYIDGGSRGNPGPAACAWVLKAPDGTTLKSGAKFLDQATNNVAEYTALIKGLAAADTLGIRHLSIFSDSELLVRQVTGEYRVRNATLRKLFAELQRALLVFDCWHIQHIGREKNIEADRLVNMKLDEMLA